MKKPLFLDSLSTSRADTWHTLELYFLFKAWKILSKEEIAENDLKFNTFYNQKLELNKLISIWNELGKRYEVFNIYLSWHKEFSTIEIEKLVHIINAMQSDELKLNVNDAFYNMKHLYNDYIVSNQIAEFGMKLVDASDIDSIYIPFTNGFAPAYYTDKECYYEPRFSPFINQFIIGHLINIIDKKKIKFNSLNPLQDPLLNPIYINTEAPHLLKEFSAVLSFPPLGQKDRYDIINYDKYNRFERQKGTTLDIAHFEHILAQTEKRAVVLMAVGFTYRSGVEEKFRKYLIEENLLEGIIQLPPNLHSATSIETTFFVINKKKTTDNVFFLNLKDEHFLKKEGRKIILENIDKIIEIYGKKIEINDISTLIIKENIRANNYSLAIDRYVVSKEAKELQSILSSYETIALQDIAEIRRSQLFKDEGEGKEVYELSPSDFSKAGFTKEGGKLKKIGSQFKKYETYKLQAFDILISTKGTIGKVAIVGEITEPLLASQASQVIRVKDRETAIEIYMFFKSDIGQSMLRQLVAGTAMPQIATSEIKKIPIPILSKNEKKHVLLNFNNEIKMYNEIDKINIDIKYIHNNFLGKI